MTDSDTRTEVWKPIPGAGYYEASDHGGRIRSVDRTIGGRFYEGRLLTAKKTGTSPYWQVKLTYDDGKQRTRTVHALVLEAHVGLPEPGQQACHLHDDPDINDLSELRWDWRIGNEEDRKRNTPPRPPKPLPTPTLCVNYERCGNPAGRGGRRCHPCVVGVGEAGAILLAQGADLERAAEQLDYASSVGLFRLAVKYGGLRLVIDQAAVTESGHAPSPNGRLRSVISRWKAWLADSDCE